MLIMSHRRPHHQFRDESIGGRWVMKSQHEMFLSVVSAATSQNSRSEVIMCFIFADRTKCPISRQEVPPHTFAKPEPRSSRR